MTKDPEDHFNHLVKMARRTTPPGTALVPHPSLAVEMTQEQQSLILNPSEVDYTIGSIIQAAGGTGGSVALPKRKLDAMCAVRGQSGFLNDEGRMKKMKAQLDLAQSIASIQHAQHQEKKAKAAASVEGLFDQAPAALSKLRCKGGDEEKLTKTEICAIAHRYFATELDMKLKKPPLVQSLKNLVEARPTVLPAVVLSGTDATAPCAPSLVGATNDEDEKESGDESD